MIHLKRMNPTSRPKPDPSIRPCVSAVRPADLTGARLPAWTGLSSNVKGWQKSQVWSNDGYPSSTQRLDGTTIYAAPARPPWHHPWPFLGRPSNNRGTRMVQGFQTMLSCLNPSISSMGCPMTWSVACTVDVWNRLLQSLGADLGTPRRTGWYGFQAKPRPTDPLHT